MKKNVIKATIILSMLLLTLIPLSVSAATSGTCGDNLMWTLNDDGLLTISGIGTMYDYYSYDYPWNSSRSTITSVKIENGVENIGSSAFYYCKNIRNCDIPDSITSIGNYAFMGTALEKITISKYVHSIGTGAFGDILTLSTIDVDSSNPFYLSENNVLFDKNKTHLLRYAPQKEDSQYVIPDSVKIIGDCSFSRCSNLTQIQLPEGVLRINYAAFAHCSNLLNINIPDSITHISNESFQRCSSLQYIVIPNGISSIGSLTFEGCTSLTSVTFPNSILSIQMRAFYNCDSLKDVYYQGRKGQWNKIRIDATNGHLINSTIHFLSNGTDTEVFESKFIVTPSNIPNGSIIIFVCYHDKQMVYVNPYIYAGESTIPFTTTEKYDKVKVMVWENLKTCVPLCEAENVPLN